MENLTVQKNEKYASQGHNKFFPEIKSNNFPLKVFCCCTSMVKLVAFIIPAKNTGYQHPQNNSACANISVRETTVGLSRMDSTFNEQIMTSKTFSHEANKQAAIGT